MRKTFALLLFTILFLPANSQSNKDFFKQFEFGGEGGLALDYLFARDPADNLRHQSTRLETGMGGVKIRRYIDTNFFLEIAFLWKENVFGFRFKQEPGVWLTNASKIFIIPLRTGYDWYVSNKVTLATFLGIVPSFITLSSEGSGGYGGNIAAGNNIVNYDYQARDGSKKFYLTIQPGISFNHLIKKRIKFSVGVNYYHGFRDIELTDVSYSINNGAVQNAVIVNRGSFINYNGSLTYRFNLGKR